MSLIVRVKTAFSLGLINLGRVLFYRIGIYVGWNSVKKISIDIPDGIFFRKPKLVLKADLEVNSQWQGQHCYFSRHYLSSLEVPNWHTNPLNGKSVEGPFRAWWLIPDFDHELGDIKTIWEASRFDWLLGFAQRACQGDEQNLKKINYWLEHWVSNNPPYLGPNWKCGQEASIRVMHLAISALILNQIQDSEPALVALVKAHLMRIEPTISYAIAQDNNHGTSEAAALFIGGSWLSLCGDCQGKRWAKVGRKWLEDRASKLVEEDGSFSQYSVNYHRVMLDTYSIVEIWRQKLELSIFSELLYSRMSKAAHWLHNVTQFSSGDAPNLGANDGARLFPLDDTDYRDYRPSVQLAMVLFNKCCAWSGDGSWNLPLKWLDIEIPAERVAPQLSQQFDKGGYVVLRKGDAFLLLNYPRFRFRPSQSDALHIDLWLRGENLLRDAGTFSYNSDNKLLSYFGGTESHNTIQFDGRDQMPRIGRFLLGSWLKTSKVFPLVEEVEQLRCGAGYTDSFGASHERSITLHDQSVRIEDKISGFCDKAVMRWRLQPGNWEVNGHTLSNGENFISISSDVPIDNFLLLKGWESRYYLDKSEIPVLEVVVSKPGCLVTEYRFS